MKKINRWLGAATLAAAMLCGGNLLAQDRPGRGSFDPSQFRERMMERVREQLEVKDDTDWKALQPLVQKVMDARMQSMSGMGRGMFGGGSRRGGGDNNNTDSNNGGDRQRRGAFGQEPSPEAEALQKAIDAKASNAELKTAMAKYVEARKAKQAGLEKAQADLRAVLSVRQEAIATNLGLL
jgi:hypothetical protein